MNLIRLGRVSSVDAASCTARVAFEDQSGVVSANLPVIVRGAAETQDYWMPAIGEQVVCVFLSNDCSQGFILGTPYSRKNTPPIDDAKKRRIQFNDDSYIEYDPTTHTLKMDIKGLVNIVATGDVNVSGDVIADGISLKNHTHSGVTVGSGDTGPPNGGA